MAIAGDLLPDRSLEFLSRNAVQHGIGGHGIGLDELGAIGPQLALVDVLASGWTDAAPDPLYGSFVYRQGYVVRFEGAIGTPVSPSADDVILTLPVPFVPVTTRSFRLFDVGTDANAYVKVMSEAEAPGHGGEMRWISGAHGVGKVLWLSDISYLDPYRRR